MRPATNYKSLADVGLSFSGFDVLVGNNASGKSNILQAIDFLMRSASEDFIHIIGQRNFLVSDIICKFRQKKQISFNSKYLLNACGKEFRLNWELIVEANQKENKLKLLYEKIVNIDDNRTLLSYDHDKMLRVAGQDYSLREYPMLSLDSSALKIAVSDQEESNNKELFALKIFLDSSCSFDMLSPSEMLQSSRGRTSSIGTSGRDLAAFIKTMSKEQKESFMKTIKSLLGGRFIENVEAHTEGKPGWTTIETIEKYGNKNVRISSKGMSDGMLRLLAFVSINEMKTESSLVLLDEIENGINSNYAETLIELMKQSYKKKHRQIITTTHSTVFLDYVSPSDITYLYRDEETGFTKAVKMLDISGMEERVTYMYPGEVFMNLSNNEIMDLILKSEGDSEAD